MPVMCGAVWDAGTREAGTRLMLRTTSSWSSSTYGSGSGTSPLSSQPADHNTPVRDRKLNCPELIEPAFSYDLATFGRELGSHRQTCETDISEDGGIDAEVSCTLNGPAVPEQGELAVPGELRSAARIRAQPPDGCGQLDRISRLEVLDDVIVVGG